jgi:hypothetical protein
MDLDKSLSAQTQSLLLAATQRHTKHQKNLKKEENDH